MLLPGQKSHFFANAMGFFGVRLLLQVPSAFVHHSYAPIENTRVRDVSAGRCIARKLLACAVAVLVAACGQSPDSTATDDPAAASMEQFRDWSELPDWSGWWEMEGGFEAVRAASQAGGQSTSGNGVRPVLANLEVYQPEARRIAAAARVPGVNRGGVGVYCIPHRFNGGINGGRTNDVEFLLMPQRLTITNGDGLLRAWRRVAHKPGHVPQGSHREPRRDRGAHLPDVGRGGYRQRCRLCPRGPGRPARRGRR